MVVFAGITVCVPPEDGNVYVLPSVPVTVTWVALNAVTVRVDEFPEMTVVGFAVMLTEGTGFDVTVIVAVAEAAPPFPVAATV